MEYMHVHVRVCTSVPSVQRAEESAGKHPSRLVIMEKGL